ncbi:hypothetical protein TNCV_1468091 [Trichonephila clavipes]|uniref:Uncharacterized protein n=1 Tax=Trichonephila clavipes TaxID=2585209 RepID=A0A8X6V758_TRICX|nr:hypothetical protein TNCV_1468091 [Trichonephila clavipes]
MVIRSEGAVEYVMVGVSRRPTQAIWRGKEIEPVQVRSSLQTTCGCLSHSFAPFSDHHLVNPGPERSLVQLNRAIQ